LTGTEVKRRRCWRRTGNGVPFMDIEGIYITGCSEKRIKQAIDQRRAL